MFRKKKGVANFVYAKGYKESRGKVSIKNYPPLLGSIFG